MRLFAVLIAALLVVGTSACKDQQGSVCDPHTVRADPYNPGAYRVCNGEGTNEEKYYAPRPTPNPVPVRIER